VAVIAVVLYHAGLSVWGGFLGVESFFVLSGFLITSLLLVEWQQHERISLTSFWMRRARRLLPALLLVIGIVVGFTVLVLPNEVSGLTSDALASLGYVMNWHLILGSNSYFDPFARPPLLQHVWSLAIEEQFYLLWPLLFIAGMRVLRRIGLLIAVLVVALGSTLLMAWLYTPGVDPSRVYYGTDTRATALLLGAALALVWLPGAVPASQSRKVGWILDIIGVAALAGLLASFLLIHDYQPWLYQGGFAVVSLTTVGAIAAVAHPQARVLPGLLGVQPLRWLGERSYGIYLWHWPVFMVTRPYSDIPFDGWQLFVIRLAIVLVLTELSYRFVEMPIRQGALSQAGQSLRVQRHRVFQSRPVRIWQRRREARRAWIAVSEAHAAPVAQQAATPPISIHRTPRMLKSRILSRMVPPLLDQQKG
jgi:peptidoglycan/LPS O-acetylase OafA/YrhL